MLSVIIPVVLFPHTATFNYVHLQIWSTGRPSRRFYAARRDEYDELLKQRGKNRLTLSKKRKMVTVDLTSEKM